MKPDVTIIGGGLAGTEAAWQVARAGLSVRLYEMRPSVLTPAHRSGDFAEHQATRQFGLSATTQSRLAERGVISDESSARIFLEARLFF